MIDAGEVREKAKQLFPQIQKIRRHLHQHPELSFHEFETSQYVAGILSAHGVSFRSGLVKTGLLATIGTKNTGKHIALRADLDALPIEEKNDCEYRSLNPGIMHACGHDVHTASLVGACLILQHFSDRLNGTVKAIFQPGEELLPGGASLMIKEGVLDNPVPSGILAQHVYPSLEAGKVGFREGKYMASTDELYITVNGKGGHAAMPHMNADPVLAAAAIITSLQQVIARNAHPHMPTVIAIGKVTANGATNVIPDTVAMEGTLRTMNEEWRLKAQQRIHQVAESVAKAHGVTARVEIRNGYPVLENDPLLTRSSRSFAEEYLGKENVVDLEMRMTAEDFAYYTHVTRGCFYRLGTGNAGRGITSPVHTSTFDIDESALETGAGLLAWLAIKHLQQE